MGNIRLEGAGKSKSGVADSPRSERFAAAAQAVDFADAAHLTRTFYQMVGMAPSVLMRGKFAEIRSPFFGSGENSSAAVPVPRPPIR